MEIAPDEIEPGLVSFLHPGILEDMGAACATAAIHRIKGEHFFVCLTAPDPDGDATWIPCSSKKGSAKSVTVPEAARTGHPGWRVGACYALVGQLWVVDGLMVTAASFGDLSTKGQRNRMDLTAVLGKGKTR